MKKDLYLHPRLVLYLKFSELLESVIEFENRQTFETPSTTTSSEAKILCITEKSVENVIRSGETENTAECEADVMRKTTAHRTTERPRLCPDSTKSKGLTVIAANGDENERPLTPGSVIKLNGKRGLVDNNLAAKPVDNPDFEKGVMGEMPLKKFSGEILSISGPRMNQPGTLVSFMHAKEPDG